MAGGGTAGGGTAGGIAAGGIAVGGAGLAERTTLGLGGQAKCLVEAGTDAAVIAAVGAADLAGEPVLVLGGGSNLVVADAGFPGTVVAVATAGRSVRLAPERLAPERASPPSAAGSVGGGVAVEVLAGENWDGLVGWAVGEGLAGIECLAGIPGLVGATPVQNVGAYGQEVGTLIESVRVYDRDRRAERVMTAAECGFGYRTSVFKRSAQASAGQASAAQASAGQAGAGLTGARPTGRYVVLSVTFRLGRGGLSAPVTYAELAARLGVAEGGRAPLAKVREAVLELRRGKGMVLDPADPDSRSAGSFFTNPVLSPDGYGELLRRAGLPEGAVPRFPAGPDAVKVPAAWLIERAGFARGYPGHGVVRISAKHTLALTTRPGATAAALIGLAREIATGVKARFGVELTPEPVLVGVEL